MLTLKLLTSPHISVPCLLVGVVLLISGSVQGADNSEELQQVKFKAGDLTVVIGNHMPHAGAPPERRNYEGIHHLSHRLRPTNVFRPIYAGMIGVRRPCEVKPIGKTGAVISAGQGKEQITETFRVTPPHYIDYTVIFPVKEATGGWNNTCYMNDLETPELYVRQIGGRWARHYSKEHGHQASVAPFGMDPLPPVNRVPNAEYPHGSNNFWEGFSDLRFDPNYPVVFGRIEKMVLIYMAERRLGSSFIPYMSPTGGGGRKNPAWDFRYWLRGLTPGERLTIRIRLCYKPWAGEDDVINEYETWQKELTKQTEKRQPPLVKENLRYDRITEVRITTEHDKAPKVYELNLTSHHSPATYKTPALEKWESYKLGAFLCFNSNQFSGSEHCQTKDPNIYNPTDLDVPGWVDAIKKAQMKYAVLTVRHTSGFLLWDSPTTDFDVGSSPNKTDVVKEFVDNCNRRSIAPGLYYCMWGGEWRPNPNARAIILAQLYELAANYGEIPYFWIDMMNWAPKDLPARQVYNMLKNLQPDTIVILNQHIQDGSEIKFFPTDILNGEHTPPPASGHNPHRKAGTTTYYLPFEYEPVSQDREGAKRGVWFTYGEGKSFTPSFPFPTETLAERIKLAYERGASNVLLSLAPDHTGSMRDNDVKELVHLAKLLNKD